MAFTKKRKLKNILVTGGAGFIGSNFVQNLFGIQGIFSDFYAPSDFAFSAGSGNFCNAEPFDGTVVVLDALTYAADRFRLCQIESQFGKSQFFFVHGDICERQLVERIFSEYDIDTVVHFAAESHVDRSIKDSSLFVQTNVLGTQTLLESARHYWNVSLDAPRDDVIFLHISTDEVFGSAESGFFTEQSPYAPRSPYSASKASSDMLALSYATTYSLPVIVTNCSNNYGAYQHTEKFIPLMIHNAVFQKELPLYGTGTQVRDWICVSDHVAALSCVLKNGRAGERYNIGGGNIIENRVLLELILHCVAEECAIPFDKLKNLIAHVKDRPGHDARYAVDFSKLTKETGWLPKVPFEEGLKRTVRWYVDKLRS